MLDKGIDDIVWQEGEFVELRDNFRHKIIFFFQNQNLGEHLRENEEADEFHVEALVTTSRGQRTGKAGAAG